MASPLEIDDPGFAGLVAPGEAVALGRQRQRADRGPALADLDLAGSVDVGVPDPAVGGPDRHAAAARNCRDLGDARALAVAAPERHFALPDVPTFAELGLPSVEAATWAGVFVPKGTPAAVVQELNAAFARVLAQKPVQDALRANGVQVQSLQGERFRSFVTGEIKRWGQLVREAKITPE